MVISISSALGWTIFGCVYIICMTIIDRRVANNPTPRQNSFDLDPELSIQPLQIGLDPDAINHHVSKEIKNFGRYGNDGDVDSSYSQGRIDSYKDIRYQIELGKFNHK